MGKKNQMIIGTLGTGSRRKGLVLQTGEANMDKTTVRWKRHPEDSTMTTHSNLVGRTFILP